MENVSLHSALYTIAGTVHTAHSAPIN